jgi:hypothetical protein
MKFEKKKYFAGTS